jgi:hypothetical protein
MLRKNYEIGPEKVTIGSDCHRYYPFLGLYWAMDLSFLVLGALGLGGVLNIAEKYRLAFGVAFLVAGLLIAAVDLYVTLVLVGEKNTSSSWWSPPGSASKAEGRRGSSPGRTSWESSSPMEGCTGSPSLCRTWRSSSGRVTWSTPRISPFRRRTSPRSIRQSIASSGSAELTTPMRSAESFEMGKLRTGGLYAPLKIIVKQ